MERLAWRGVVRVILPRTMVPTEGRRAPVGLDNEVVGAFDDLEVDEVDINGPATLAKRLSPWMWVPSPTLLAFVGPRSWPGRAIGVLVIVRCYCIGVIVMWRERSEV